MRWSAEVGNNEITLPPLQPHDAVWAFIEKEVQTAHFWGEAAHPALKNLVIGLVQADVRKDGIGLLGVEGVAVVIGRFVRSRKFPGGGEFAGYAGLLHEETDGGKIELPERPGPGLQQGENLVPVVFIIGRCLVGRV